MSDIRTVANAIVAAAQEEGKMDIQFPFCVERSSGIIYQWQTLGDEGVLIKHATPELQSTPIKLTWPAFQRYFRLYEGSNADVLGSIADPDEGPPVTVERKRRR